MIGICMGMQSFNPQHETGACIGSMKITFFVYILLGCVSVM